ncbi:hypothetical protein QYE76_031082 [Lolium multiflorum]|uniref:Uncharacterized protein n=1 Tax=Lolium multiflorum TaxID=4521 RepID=A0AAD8QUC9_LOLMU|nr:hypothetical protein QYE76_031082 [Lolium multiflorum]
MAKAATQTRKQAAEAMPSIQLAQAGPVEMRAVTWNGSSTWQAVEHGLQLLKLGVIWRVGTGSKIRAWRDPWIPRESSRIPRSSQGRCRFRWVADFILPDGTWNLQCLPQYFLVDDVTEILKIQPSQRYDEDFIAWFPEKRAPSSIGAVCGKPVGTRRVIGCFDHVIYDSINIANAIVGPFIVKLGKLDLIRVLRVYSAQRLVSFDLFGYVWRVVYDVRERPLLHRCRGHPSITRSVRPQHVKDSVFIGCRIDRIDSSLGQSIGRVISIDINIFAIIVSAPFDIIYVCGI